jgi:hypothetical protein
MTISSIDRAPCRAADPDMCELHAKRKRLEKMLESAQVAFDFEAYHENHNQLDALDFTIMLEEWNDFTAIGSNFPDSLLRSKEQSDSIAIHLRQVSKNNDYSHITWMMFSKLCVQYLSAQSYGAVLERMYIKEHDFIKVPSTDERGDFSDPTTGKFSEFKVTASDLVSGSKVNFVQIRPHHNIDDYHLVIVDKQTGVSELFVLTKEQMQAEIEATGSRLAHGSGKTNTYVNKEYAIRFSTKPNDIVYTRWKKLYGCRFPLK